MLIASARLSDIPVWNSMPGRKRLGRGQTVNVRSPSVRFIIQLILGYDEPYYYTHDFIPLNGDELVIPYDSDHIYISDAFETGEISLITGEYVTHKGKVDTLIRKQ